MKRELPTEREIAEMIASAFERLPAPDARRLAAIEQQLLEQPRLRRRTKIAWWWLAAALVAGAASALWWAVDYDSGEGQEEPVSAITPSTATTPAEQAARPDEAGSTESVPAGNPVDKRSPQIFRREQ